MPIRVAAIYRYPVKGLSPEPLERVTLTPGECLPHDRRFALARASTRFDPAQPAWLPKTNFFMLSDAQQKPDSTTYQYVSLVNLASVGELEKVVQIAVDPLRFRANFYLSGLSAWNERDWVGSEIRAGNARLRVVSPITRCAATSVNPATAERDLNIPAILQKEFGHNCMGVYAEVVAGGEVAKNDRVGRTDNARRIE